jgi:catechol 2,3-dioxygenase-like lactoylglutathione lyase family enzyme
METPICQVALSVSDIARSRAWYERLGLEYTGSQGPVSGELPAKMLDLPEIEARLEWLAGQDPMSQLEVIHFARPGPRPLPRDWNLTHAGYGLVGVVVPRFETVLHEFSAGQRKFALTGEGKHRSLWLTDPDGIPVEIMEADPLGRLGGQGRNPELACIRSVTITVADLDKAVKFWTSGIGLSPWAPQYSLNRFPAHLAGGEEAWEEVRLKGDSVLVRLLKPRRVPVKPRSADRLLSDAGVLNVAMIFDSAKSFAANVAHVRGMGYPFSLEEPMLMGEDAGTIYGYDDQRNSIEIGFVVPGNEEKYGWKR